MDTTVITYIAYLVISICLTVWVGRTLYRNGAHFLVDVFDGNTELAKAVNHLLVVGFYLVNLGFVSLSLKISDAPTTAREALEALSLKVGAVLLVLGILHLGNIYVFNRIRSRSQETANSQKAPTRANRGQSQTWAPPAAP
jgi:hypothetical protein